MEYVDNHVGTVNPELAPAGYRYQGDFGRAVGFGLEDPNWVRVRRPYYDKHGRAAITILNNNRYTTDRGVRKLVPEQVLIRDFVNNTGQMLPVFNATTLRKEEWLELDRQVLRASRYRLRAFADLASANSYGGFNGMSKIELEHETQSDPGEALVDMDGLSEGRSDQPLYQLQGLPLPITHSDFWVSSRKLSISRNTGTPFDVTMGEAAGHRVAESIEKTTIGNQTGPTYTPITQTGGYGRASSVYGYLNFTNRLTATGYIPTGIGRAGTGWVASDFLRDVLAARNTLYAHKFYGPYMVYTSPDFDPYLDNDYILTGGNVATQTLRERVKAIDGIQDVRRLDMMFSSTTDLSSGGPGLENLSAAFAFTVIVVQMTPDVCRAVNGLDITTVQWEAVGGMRLNFKVMAIQVPQIRADYYGNCGVLQLTCSS